MFNRPHSRRLIALFLVLPIGLCLAAEVGTPRQIHEIRTYIRRTWKVLTRSNKELAAAAVDPKFPVGKDGRWPVYVSPRENPGVVQARLRKVMSRSNFAKISLRTLPEHLPDDMQGLLYVPFPYVVPGGRFNEMYGWDSYFIQVGLLRDGEWRLAKDLAGNFLYEIKNYGKILNANRTYYLTRSQPPFLTEMVLGVYRHTHDRQWLLQAWPQIETYNRYWTTEPHLTPQTGLSRYYDSGDGPAPEVLSAERDKEGRTHYDRVREYYRTHAVADYDLSQYYDPRTGQLTPLFYKGDRSMRESGFDPSNRFGPFSVDIIHYNPVGLNALLYQMEQDMAEILTLLGRGAEAPVWNKRADERRDRMSRLMWDERDGLYYDYDFATRKVRRYPFLTTFYPLWTGIASPAQAARIEDNLTKFEQPGGLQTSTTVSGSQWDAPFGWAPLELIAVQGLRRYHYDADADRIAQKFLSLVLQEYLKAGTIVEKYDVVRRSTDVSSRIGFGYSSNEAGFGWTNAAFEELFAQLQDREGAQRRKAAGGR